VHVGYVETGIQCTVLLDDKNNTVALTVKIDALIFNNGLVDELRNCELSGFLLRVGEAFRVPSCYTAYAGTVIPRLTKIIRSGITFLSRNLR